MARRWEAASFRATIHMSRDACRWWRMQMMYICSVDDIMRCPVGLCRNVDDAWMKAKKCVCVCEADTIRTLCTCMNTKVNYQRTTRNGLTEFTDSRHFTRASPGSAEHERCTRRNFRWRRKGNSNGRNRVCFKDVARCGHGDSLRFVQA